MRAFPENALMLADPLVADTSIDSPRHRAGCTRLPRYAKRNQSANRGNIRLAETWRSEFLDATLEQWLASTRVVIGD